MVAHSFETLERLVGLGAHDKRTDEVSARQSLLQTVILYEGIGTTVFKLFEYSCRTTFSVVHVHVQPRFV